MATKPQRRQRITKEQMREQGASVAQVVTDLVVAAVRAERRRNRRHFAALWVAVATALAVGVLL